MPGTYRGHGLEFMYPENWALGEEQTDEAWAVSLQSPGTGFVQVIGHPDRPRIEDVLETTLGTLREDYPELEEETAGEMIAGCRAQGRDVHFISLDLTTTCWVRCFRSASATLLVLCQAHDLEADHLEPVFRALRKSMRLADAAPAK